MLIYWYKISIFKPELSSNLGLITCKIAVIVAVRNEKKTIKNLLDDLLLQNFPINNLEIIIINDHSTDNTSMIVETYTKKYSYIKLLQLPINLQGKKQAITYGIQHTNSELIITTDADCRVSTMWIYNIYSFYQSKKAKFISSYVKFSNNNTYFSINSLFKIFQNLDFSALIGIGAASIAMQKPTMCNGANLAYTKAIFNEVGGFSGNEYIVSGDDEFLLQKIAAKYPQDVYFLKSKNSIVITDAQENFYDFFQQRKRWASKWKLHKQWNVRLLAIFIFSIHFFSLLLPFLAFFYKDFIAFAWLFWLIKITIETLFVGNILTFLGLGKLIFFMPLASLCYPFYAIVIGIAANHKGFNWKNRNYK
jgi:cellulose synthase/poly-beta-1,6-N-acetylglucosamine synthase-like glycosyltransferase